MHIFSSTANIIDATVVSFFLSARFFVLASAVFMFLYVWKRKKYWYAKIQQRYPENKYIFHEIKYSFFTVIIFGLVISEIVWASKTRQTLIYYPIDKYGYPYYFLSIILMIVIHDAYFYWTHRFLHWKPVFKMVHKVHHRSINPTPFSSYCFHPVEALIEVGIFPLIVFTIPYHVSALAVFAVYTLVLNVAGHTGYEFFPKGFATHKIWKWHNTPTHHNMHHKFTKCNYGLYFNFWDRVMKTNHAKYEGYFDEVAGRSKKSEVVLNDAIEQQEHDATPEDALIVKNAKF
jgi:lathosterol oxidase